MQATHGGADDDDEEDEATPDWILRAVDRLAATIVSERMSTEAVGASSSGPSRRQRRRQKRATLQRWMRWFAAVSCASLVLVLAVVVLRPMAGPAALSSGMGSQLALWGASDPEACDSTGALSTLQAAMQDSSELLRDAMFRGDSAAHAAAKAQVRAPCPLGPELRTRSRAHAHASPHPWQAGLEAAEKKRVETAELLRLTAAELKAVKELLAAKEEARARPPSPPPSPTLASTLASA